MIASDPAAVRRGNARLARVCERLTIVGPGGGPLRVPQAHYAGGAFASGHRVRMHRHEQMQVEAAISGRYVFETPTGAHELAPGEVCVIGRGAPHAWSCERRGVLLGLMLTPRDGGCWEALDALLAGGADRLRMARPMEGQRLLGWAVAASISEDRRLADDRLRWSLGLWLSELVASLMPRVERSPTSGESTAWGAAALGRAIAFMRANLAQPITLHDVASEAGLSTRHLSRLFRQGHGAGVNAYLMELRLSAARRMLGDRPDDPLKRIARACGFRHASYFTRCYRRRYGRAPSAERDAP